MSMLLRLGPKRRDSRPLIGVALALLGLPTSAQQPPCPGETRPDVPEGYVVIEGDIIVPADYCLQEGIWTASLWTSGIVPYEFDANVSNANQNQALVAMAIWESVANVDFVPLAAHPSWIHIQDSTANNSAVGMQGGVQVMNITSWGSLYVIVHELGHALAYWHEQSRSDRDMFVSINWGNIQAGKEGNFQKQPAAAIYGPYDFDSVMHYDQCAFSICCPAGATCACGAGCETITVLPPNQAWQTLIGQRDHLSDLDGLIMSFLYPEPDWVFVDIAAAPGGNGSFEQPYDSLGAGVNAVPAAGVIWIQPGAYPDTGTFADPMTWEAPLGGVTIGG